MFETSVNAMTKHKRKKTQRFEWKKPRQIPFSSLFLHLFYAVRTRAESLIRFTVLFFSLFIF